MAGHALHQDRLNRELAAESITVRIRWFGLCVGYVLVNFIRKGDSQPELNAILTLGAVYAMLDTWFSLRRRVFLKDLQLVISIMEAVFIGLLCYFDMGLDSPFRFYYFLSLLVCAIRNSPQLTIATFAMHSASYIALAASIGIQGREDWTLLSLMLVFMGWVTWAIMALTGLLKSVGARLTVLNRELRENQQSLEQRIEKRTRELQESQALLVQQEKQAAFGLLAAGIAHEVGNPLASISSLVQMLNRHHTDDYTRGRLSMVDDQLIRIQRTLRELVDFSRPATQESALCDLHNVIDVALNIAKYYKRRKGKEIVTSFADNLPHVRIARDQLAQVLLNLILNAMDATEEGSTIEIGTRMADEGIRILVSDNGHGIPPRDQERLFRPYFTTKETGTGLGLFVCKRIIEEQIGGRIQLTSSSASGTTFTIVLPHAVVSARTAAHPAELADPTRSPDSDPLATDRNNTPTDGTVSPEPSTLDPSIPEVQSP